MKTERNPFLLTEGIRKTPCSWLFSLYCSSLCVEAVKAGEL